MNVDLIIAMIKRREQAAKDRAQGMERDPMLRAAARDHRAIQGAMAALRRDIEQHRELQANTD